MNRPEHGPRQAGPLGRIHWIVNLDGGAASAQEHDGGWSAAAKDGRSTAAQGGRSAAVEPLLDHAKKLFEAGLPSLQVRAKSWPTERIVAGGGALRALAREHGVLFLVNGDLEAAAKLAADGVHLPARGPSPAAARTALGPGALVGKSAHDEREIMDAAGADWVILAPVFPTGSKPGAPGMGIERFADLVALAPAPVYALGGVNRSNFASCFAVGAAGVAAVSALLARESEKFVRESLTSW